MTAPIEWPSLDKILTEVEPVEPVTFDLVSLLPHEHWCLTVAHGDCCGNGEEDCDCDAWKTRISVALIVNGLRCDIESARSKAVKLENENAEQADRIAEALKWLEVAATFSTSEDCSAAIDDARAALEVKS